MDAHPPEGHRTNEAEELARLLPAPPAPELSEDRFRELRRQVMGEIHARRPRRRRRMLVTAVAAGTLAAALYAGVSLSTESGSHRPGPGKTIYPSPAQSPTPYPTNAAGQSYGGAQEGARADLWGVVATRGENGYVWPADLSGPRPMNPEEVEWMQAFQKRREVPVYESDGVTQVGVFIAGGGGPMRVEDADGTVTEIETSNELAKQPPAWLFDSMKEMASSAGDADAWAWWTTTTAERASAAIGDSQLGGADPGRPVYVAFLVGDFTKWLWPLPEGSAAPEYSWICQVIDAKTQEVIASGASPKPFEDGKGLDLNIVGLRDRVRILGVASVAPRVPQDFDDRIATLDVGLFDLVETQSNAKDRRSWLAVQRAVREARSSFTYLEIGSYLGGSLQQYLRDPRCRRIYSIDNRTRDSRHAENSEQAMLANLRRVAPDEMDKLVCFSADASRVPASDIAEAPDICFIDGEHTDHAVLSDFVFCIGIGERDATIVFHDAGSTRSGIRECLRFLRRSGRAFRAHKLPGNTFVIALWGSPVGSDPRILRMAVAVQGERWLWSSGLTKRARRHVPPVLRPALASVRARLWGAGAGASSSDGSAARFLQI